MKKKYLVHRFSKTLAVVILSAAMLLSGCTSANELGGTTSTGAEAQTQSSQQVSTANYSASSSGVEVTTLDISDMFTERDSKTDYNESECILITLNGDAAECSGAGVTIKDGTIIIKEAGSYLLRGSYNGSIRIEAAEDAKVQLILDNVTLKQTGTAAIYGKTADKIFLTMAEGSSNQISNTGEFQAIDENNIDGAIYSKCDLTLNGNGTLTISSEKGHGIVSKDDLKITSGTYVVTAGDHGISGKDSIRILDGKLTITSVEDGLHSGNDEDADKGYVYIAGGIITIMANDDGIHGESKVLIAGGTIDVQKCKEGIEAAVVEIAGGDIQVCASDDGINATDGSASTFGGGQNFKGGQGFYGSWGNEGNTNSSKGEDTDREKTSNSITNVYLLISGGKVVVDAKGDGLDANGAIYVTGGEIYVNGPENSGNGALDYDGKAEITGGTLIAIGSNGMAMNFSSSTQGSALVTLSSTHNAGETVQLTDSKGNVIVSLTASRKFATVLVSSPLMKQGETYTLTAGSESKEFTLDQLLYGQSNGMGGMGGFGGRGNRGNFGTPNEGGQRGNFEGDPRGSFEGQPEGFDGSFEGAPNFPGDFDGNFEGAPNFPGGINGNFEGMPGRKGSQEGSTDGSFEGNTDGKNNRQKNKENGETKGKTTEETKSNDET
jgi:hypothetical protein